MPTQNLGQIAGIAYGTTAPTNTKMLWYDENPAEDIVKYYNKSTSTWDSFDGVGVFVPLAGGTMTGTLVLSGAPTSPLHAVTKAYVDSAVSSAGGTLAGILAGGNTSGGTNIALTSGDTLKFSEGLGGTLTSAITTAPRTWTLPDADGALLLGSGVDGKVARWVSGALGSGVLLDNGTTAGLGTLDGAVAFNILTTLSKGIRVHTTAPSGIGIEGWADSITTGEHIGGKFTGSSSTDSSSIGVLGIGDNSTGNTIGGKFISVDGKSLSIGVLAEFSSGNTHSRGAAILGIAGSGAKPSQTNVSVAALMGEGVSGSITGLPGVSAAIIGKYYGLSSARAYGAYIESGSINTANNTGIYVDAANGATNYALIVNRGLVGLGVPAPTRILEVSSGIGSFTVDTSPVTAAYEFGVVLSDTEVTLKSTAAKHLSISLDTTTTSSFRSTGELAVGNHTAVDSHLHVKFSAALAGMTGSIRGTMSSNIAYTYATPNPVGSLILENEDSGDDITSSILYRSKISSAYADFGFIATRYYSKSGGSGKSDILFGVANSAAPKEVMRLHASGNLSLGSDTDIDRAFILSDMNSMKGMTIRQDNVGVDARAGIRLSSKDSGTNYTEAVLYASGVDGDGAGLVKYFTKAGHLITDGAFGHLNLYARSATGTPLYDMRFFTGDEDYNESNLRLTIKSDGKFGFNLFKSGLVGAAVDTPLSDFHVGTGGYFEANRAGAVDHFIIRADDSTPGQGGLIITNSKGFVAGTDGVGGFKFTSKNNDADADLSNDELLLGLVEADSPQSYEYSILKSKGGLVMIGSHNDPNEKLTVDGKVSLLEGTAPTQTTGYGKIFVKSSDRGLYYLDSSGTEFKLSTTSSGGTLSGTGTANRVAYWTNSSTLSSGANLQFDGTNVKIGNNWTLPNGNGSANQVLTTNGAGIASWQNSKDWIIPAVVGADATAVVDEYILVDTTGGDVTITLPSPAANIRTGVKKITSPNILRILPPPGRTVDQYTEDPGFDINSQWDSYIFISDGINWFIQSNFS